MQIAPERARAAAQARVQHARKAARIARPPQVQPGEHHDDRPARAELEQIAAERIDRPTAVQAAAQAADPTRGRNRAEILAGIRIDEGGIRQPVVRAEEERSRMRRIVADLDRFETFARVVRQYLLQLSLVAGAVPAGLDMQQLRIRERRDLSMPEIEDARDRLP